MFGRESRVLIAPIFIPNQGCPHRCIFCLQEKITSQTGRIADGPFIRKILDKSIKSKRFDSFKIREIAFYGGTFTSLPEIRIKKLLKATEPYLKKGLFSSIRVSTRPDAIDDKSLRILKKYGVTTVELGAQSLDNEVLRLSKRGHTAADTINSLGILRQYGFRVGIQLMPGLPGDNILKFRKTIETVVDLHPDLVRLYPTVVIKGTKLAEYYKSGKYNPLSVEKAVNICMESCVRLEEQGIPVIRIGLMSSPTLLQNGQIIAGPWHNAFGFLVRSGIHLRRIEQLIPKSDKNSRIGIRAPYKEIPNIRGYKNRGLRYLEEKIGVKIEYVRSDDSVSTGKVKIDFL